MGNENTRRSARYAVNKQDTPEYLRYRVLAVMLSSLPAETQFGRGENNLDLRLCSILRGESAPVIKDNFDIPQFFGSSRNIDDLLSAHVGYGNLIGLSNWGNDFAYRMSEVTHRVAHEVEEMQLLNQEDIAYLKDLGKKLLPAH